MNRFSPIREAIDLAIKTAEVLNIQVAGIDLLYADDGYTVCEANTFPGFRGLETACEGLNVPREIFTDMQKQLEAERTGHLAPVTNFEDIRAAKSDD